MHGQGDIQKETAISTYIGTVTPTKYIEITKKRLNWGSSLGNVEFRFYKENEFEGVIE